MPWAGGSRKIARRPSRSTAGNVGLGGSLFAGVTNRGGTFGVVCPGARDGVVQMMEKVGLRRA